jgi:hypothetical protein
VGVVQAQGLSIALIIIATVLFLAAFFMRQSARSPNGQRWLSGLAAAAALTSAILQGWAIYLSP